MTELPPNDQLLETLRTRLGAQYEIEGLLGRGGMGSVFRARDLTLDRAVAIKVIAGDVASNPQLRERFLQEARTVAKLRHPNIVAVYSAGDARGLLYFAMELVPGESLRELLDREKKVEPARAERILHELALALDYAHANGIVHRDVKPENILLDRETGRAMLTDFGVARALEGDGRMTGTGMILGSPRYMSPEQATGETTIDGRSDLYALALVGYEMFTGKPVVEAGNVAAMLVKHLTETPKPIADAATAVPEGVATAIDRALAKDRDQRWATGREMAEVIGMAWTPMGGTSGAGSRTGVRTGVLGAAKARPRWFLPAAAAAVVALGSVAYALLGGGGSAPRGVDPRRSYAVMPFEVQTGNRDVQWLRDGAVNMLTLALAQWRDLTVADYERTMVLVREAGLEEKRVDLDRALQIARRAGAWTVVTGTITTTNDSLRVDARLYDVASGRPLQTESRSALLSADPRPLFDGLARYLLGVAGGSATESVDLAAATTTSIAAYRAYLDGTRALFSWRVAEADSLFAIAVRADSTFALAHHKRSLALGWGDFGGPAYFASAQRALELSDRLPERERALVKGHYHLALGLQKATRGEASRPDYREAQATYRGLIAVDSGVAEAWYGLADALYHEQFDTDSIPQSLRRWTESLRGFHRTLALDSTFHLAYSHLVQMYQQYAARNNELLLVGDSVVVFTDTAAFRRAGGQAMAVRLKDEARARGLDLARAWARADEGAVAPLNLLVQGFLGAGLLDSAQVTIDRAMTRESFRNLNGELWAGSYRFLGDDPRGAPGLLEATRRASVAELRRVPLNERFTYLALALGAAGASGSGAEIDRVAALWARTDTVLPANGGPSAAPIRFHATALHAAQTGRIDGARRDTLLRGLRAIDQIPGMSQSRFGAVPVAYLGYLISRDTAFSGYVRRLIQAPQARWPELDAAEALARGDTAAARTFAATFAPADSVRTAQLGMAGMRTALRAEVIAALGNPREAVKQYENLHPARFSLSLVDPGHTVYVRTFAARARLYEQLGERDKALGAWEEFLRRWEQGDQATEPARREARAAIQRLRDQPSSR